MRSLRFEAIVNFRDLGGIPCADGRPLRAGRIFRSGHHGAATAADLEAIAAIRPALYADLRRPVERARLPTRRAEACGARVLEHGHGRPDDEAPHLAYLMEPGLDEEVLFGKILGFYGAYHSDPGLISVAGETFRLLSDGLAPALVHCHAGKDRTGFMIALILHALGASREDIFADYLLSNDAASSSADAIARTFGDGPRPDVRLLMFLMRVDARYLDAALAAAAAAHGSLDAYLDRELGVTAEARRRLRGALVEA